MSKFSKFISGMAGAGADLLRDQIKADTETQEAIKRAQAASDIAAARDERVRAMMAERVSKYSAPIEQRVAGAATAFDDDGNSTAPNDYKTMRDPTTDEMGTRALKDGNLPAATTLKGMAFTDERLADAKERERNRILLEREKIDSREMIERDRNTTKLEMYTDKEGNVKARGPGAAEFNRSAMALQHRVDQRERDIRDTNKQLDKLDENGTMPPDKKAARERELRAELVKSRALVEKLYDEQTAFLAGRGSAPPTGMSRGAPPPGAVVPAPSDAPGSMAKPMSLPKNKDGLSAGNYYITSRGLAKWNGTEFEQ